MSSTVGDAERNGSPSAALGSATVHCPDDLDAWTGCAPDSREPFSGSGLSTGSPPGPSTGSPAGFSTGSALGFSTLNRA
ncbi:hypothetical protein [Actinomadura rupiterrae]|uniref:hypothetical protein n=1 Tax=Actinomadura rupiterrae TaxID=559627 RepID=UPI0020A3CA50|nr:hypothetical protein [Actinomadura rupiterrae]MCP2339580.1 hypothetical protein [Actinomadura rupiterrae]